MKKRLFSVLVFSALLGCGIWISNSVLSNTGGSISTNEVGWVDAQLLKTTDGDTIQVKFDNDYGPHDIKHEIRLAGIDAPKSGEPCFPAGSSPEETLTRWLSEERQVRILLDATWDTHIPYQLDKFGRLLGYAQTGSGQVVQISLVAEGLAHAYVVGGVDKIPDTFIGNFGALYASQIINSQIEAAKAKVGWWKTCDSFQAAELVIAAINYWDTLQIAYLVNRGQNPIPLNQFSLSDKEHKLDFGADCPIGSFELKGGEILQVRTHNLNNLEESVKRGTTIDCDFDYSQKIVDWYVYPYKHGNNEDNVVWNKTRVELACLFRGQANSECSESQAPYYLYKYPLDEEDTND